MHASSLLSITSLFSIALAIDPVNHAGAPQDAPPTSTALLTEVPTVVNTEAPLEVMPSFTDVSTISTPLTNPQLNSSSTAFVPSGNLSTTLGSRTTTASSSIVLITTSLAGGEPTTITSVVGGGEASPTSPASSSASGSTQPGGAGRMEVRKGALGALVVAVGIGALVL